MITTEEARANVGRGVVYKSRGPGKVTFAIEHAGGYAEVDVPASKPVREDGVITSANDSMIFVRYGGDRGSKATRPEDLEWLS